MTISYDRQKETPQISEYWISKYFNESGEHVPAYDTPEEVFWKAEGMKGQTTPNFHALKKSGALIPYTAWLQQSVEHHFNHGTYTDDLGAGPRTWTDLDFPVTYHGLMINNVHSPADTAYAQSYVQAAASNIMNSGWDALTFASEIPNLGRMFRGVAKRMKRLHERKYSFKPQRGKRGNLGKEFSFENLWLEGRYGWRTLAYDVRDFSDAVANFDESRRIWTERVGSSVSVQDVYQVDTPWQAGTVTSHVTDTTTHSIRGAVAAEVSPARFIIDPLQTGWELAPYSFVIDWFLGVGNSLASTKLQLLAKAHTASVGVKSVSKRTVNCTATPNGSYEQTYNGSYSGVFTQTSRVPTFISLLPSFTGRLLDAQLVLDMRALVSGGKKPLRR